MSETKRIADLESEILLLGATIRRLQQSAIEAGSVKDQLTIAQDGAALLRIRANKAESALSVLRNLFKEELEAIERVSPGGIK